MEKPRIVFVSGNFNVLHPGHLRLLRFAKQCGDRLVVAVESDALAGSAAHVPEKLRLEGVRSIAWVDAAFLVNEPIPAVIGKLRPDFVVKGQEHENRFNSEKAAVESYGGKLMFSSGESSFSSIDLIKKEFEKPPPPGLSLPTDYMVRHGITVTHLSNLITSFSTLNVCVIGDLIVDEYISCEPLGMSQEDPTIVVRPIDSQRFVGGAGIVAAHARGLGAAVKFVSVAGEDDIRRYANDVLQSIGVSANLLIEQSRPTTLKQRFRSRGKTLLRVSQLHQRPIPREIEQKIENEVFADIDSYDAIIFSDFNYGCLPTSLVDRITLRAKESGIVLAADSQSSSQIGDIARFKGMNLVTPTEREARISTRNQSDGLIVLAEQLRQLSRAENILLKLGEEGLIVHATDPSSASWSNDQVSAFNLNPRDVSGAGDSLLTAATLTICAGGSIWESAVVGSLAAAVQIGRIGNSPLSVAELSSELLR